MQHFEPGKAIVKRPRGDPERTVLDYPAVDLEESPEDQPIDNSGRTMVVPRAALIAKEAAEKRANAPARRVLLALAAFAVVVLAAVFYMLASDPAPPPGIPLGPPQHVKAQEEEKMRDLFTTPSMAAAPSRDPRPAPLVSPARTSDESRSTP